MLQKKKNDNCIRKQGLYCRQEVDKNNLRILGDTSLTTSVLNQALSLCSKLDILNTDQGSQYTASAHVDKSFNKLNTN